MIFGRRPEVKEGMIAKREHCFLDTPVGMGLLGRVINTLGEPIDGKGRSIQRSACQLNALPQVLSIENLSTNLFKRVLKLLIL